MARTRGMTSVPFPGIVDGRVHPGSVKVFASGDRDRACLCVDDPPRKFVALVDVPRGRVLAECSLQRSPSPPAAGVDLADPRWKLLTGESDADGTARSTLSWIDPSTATVLATVTRPWSAWPDDLAMLDGDSLLLWNTRFRREGVTLVAGERIAKAVVGTTLAPAVDRARGVAWMCVPRGSGANRKVTLLRVDLTRGTAAKRQLDLPWAQRIVPSEDGSAAWALHCSTAVRVGVRARDIVVLERCEVPDGYEVVACAWDGRALVCFDFENERLATLGDALPPDVPLRGIGDHVAPDASHAFFLRDQVLWRVDLRTARRESFQPGHDSRVDALAWSPRGDHLVSSAAHGRSLVWTLDRFEPNTVLQTNAHARGAAFACDGTSALITSAYRAPPVGWDEGAPMTALHAFDLPSGATRAVAAIPSHTWGLRCSPDGAWGVPSFGEGRDAFSWFDLARGGTRSVALPTLTRSSDPSEVTDGPPLSDRNAPDTWKPFWCAGFTTDGQLVVLHTVSDAHVHPPRVAVTHIDPARATVRSTRVCRRSVSINPGARLSTDGARVALRLHQRLVVLDLTDLRAVWCVEAPATGGVSFWGGSTCLGRAVLVYTDRRREVVAVRLDGGSSASVHVPDAWITSLALAPDEREVAAGLSNGRVLRWAIDFR